MVKAKKAKIKPKTKLKSKTKVVRKKKAAKPKTKVKNAKPKHYFFLLDGRPLRNLLELVESMDEMTDEIFYHHVNEFKNDFATWTRDVFEEIELAEKLDNVKDKQRHQVEILKHMIREWMK